VIVKCSENSYSDIELDVSLKKYLLSIFPNGLDSERPLILNKIYICYAIVFDVLTKWYFVLDESGVTYPTSYSSFLFEDIDRSVSRYWVVGEHYDFKGRKSPIVAFNEWACDRFFHGNMFSGDKNATSLFNRYKKLMDVEFPRPDITEKAVALGEPNWVFDNESEDSWQTNTTDALTVVPKTKKMLINPYYRGPLWES
jgi:hypothetical protein